MESKEGEPAGLVVGLGQSRKQLIDQEEELMSMKELGEIKNSRATIRIQSHKTDKYSDGDSSDEDAYFESSEKSGDYVDQGTRFSSVIRPAKAEEKPIFYLRYLTAKDRYESSDKRLEKKSWISMTYKVSNLMFGTERRSTSFVSRHDSNPAEVPGHASWLFSLEDVPNWRFMRVLLLGRLWAQTKVDFILKGYHSTGVESVVDEKLVFNSVNIIERHSLKEKDIKLVKLIVVLRGHHGDYAKWMYPQVLTYWRESKEKELPTFNFELY